PPAPPGSEEPRLRIGGRVSDHDDQLPPLGPPPTSPAPVLPGTLEPESAEQPEEQPQEAAPEAEVPEAEVPEPAVPEETAVPEEPDGGAVDAPFEGLPAAESSAVIVEALPDGPSVEHVRGEIDVP